VAGLCHRRRLRRILRIGLPTAHTLDGAVTEPPEHGLHATGHERCVGFGEGCAEALGDGALLIPRPELHLRGLQAASTNVGVGWCCYDSGRR
jgi:hypothetical protein